MADGYGIDKLEEYIDSLRDGGVTFEIQNLSKEVQQVLTYLVKMWDQTVKGDVPTQKELKELQKGFYAYLQSSQTTTKETRNYVSMMFNQLLTRIDKLDKNRTLHSMNANISNMVNSGVLNINKKGAEGNVLAQLLKGAFLSPVTTSITSFQDKLMSFLNMEKGQEKTKKRQFVEDLVEGLARSKFVGGALSDFIKLGALFIASWVKNKGTWGKILAVGLVAAAPIIGAAIAGALVRGITSLFTKGIELIATVVFTPIRWLGGKLLSIIGWGVRTLVAAILGRSALGALGGGLRGLGFKALGAATSVGAGSALITGLGTAGTTAATTAGTVGGAGAIVGLGSAGGAAVAGTATTAGTAAAATGGTIAAFVTGVGEVLLILAGIAAVIGAFWLAWRKWGPNVEKKIEDLKGKNGTWRDVFNDIRDRFNDKMDNHPFINAFAENTPFLGGAYRALRGGSNSRANITGEGEASYGSLTIGKFGEITNARQLTQAQAERYLGAYQKNDPERFSRAYEIVPAGYASMVDFQNDLTAVDVKTGKRGALLYKGASEDLQKLRDLLVHEGMDPKKANQLVYTSGIASKTSGHAKGGVHDDPLGFGFDLVGKGWSQEDLKFADPWIKAFYGQNKSLGGVANYEIERNGKHIFTTPDKGTKNAHWDVRAMNSLKGFVTQPNLKNYEEYEGWAESQRSSIKVEDKKEEATAEVKGDLVDKTDSAFDQAKAQWARINKEFREEPESQVFMPSDKQLLIDFAGTETCSKVLQNVINAQQQAYVQQR